jgi:hypothetical protein
VPAAYLASGRLQNLAAAQRVRRRRFANYKRLAPGRGRRLFEKQLSQPPLARPDRVAVEQGHGAHDFGRTEVKANREAMFDRSFPIRETVQPNRQHS